MVTIKKFLPIFLLVLLLCSCDVDPYKGKRPIEQKGSVWVCDEYDITFSVNMDGELTNAFIKIFDDLIPFTFLWSSFDNTVNINFEYENKEDYLSGECKFGENQFTISIKDTKGYFEEQNIILTFLKTS